jgi:hypothetical protein
MTRRRPSRSLPDDEEVELKILARRLIELGLWRNVGSSVLAVTRTLQGYCERGYFGIYMRGKKHGDKWFSSLAAWREFWQKRAALARPAKMPSWWINRRKIQRARKPPKPPS